MIKRDKEFYERQNRIIEKLASIELSTNDNRYCWALFRKTFGFGQYEDHISREQYKLLTGIRETHISDTRSRLKKRNIIYKSKKTEGFNLNTDQWEIVQLSGLLKIVQLSGPNSPRGGVKNSPAVGTPLSTKRKNSPKKGSCYAKLSGKEIDKLELDDWYRAIMFNQGKFSIYYIEGTIDDYPYNTRMSCWYLYEEAKDIRDKEAYFSTLLDNYAKEKK